MPKLCLFSALLNILVFTTSHAHAAEPSGTYFRDWLLFGPIALNGPDPEAADAHHLKGFDRNYFEAQGAEGEIRPSLDANVVFPGGEGMWKAWQSPTDDIDLNVAISREDGVLAYAYTEFDSDRAQAAVLALGSNDGCRVWLNGEEVFDFSASRGLALDDDLIPVLLLEGTNRLLLKVEDKGNAWGFACRLLALDENDLWKHLNIFRATQISGQNATLNFEAPTSLLSKLLSQAQISIFQDNEDQALVWSGPWTGQQKMTLPLDTTSYADYLLTAEVTFAGGMKTTMRQPLSVGTPVDYTLFEDGKSDYVIALDDKASESEKWAVQELQTALNAISGIDFPVVNPTEVGDHPLIVIGWNALTQQRAQRGMTAPESTDESFRYYNQGRDIVIAGGSQRGTMYGVMAFLENELGVRYYTPAVTLTPKRDAFTFRLLHHTDAPGIRVRNDFYKEAFDPIWAAHNRVNGAMNSREQPGGVEGYWSVHTFYPLLSPEEFFDSHPEYFSLINGERIHERAQLCLTNPEVLDIVTERLKQRMRENPGNLIYSLSQNDWHNACECDNCRAIATKEESESGPVLWFVNQVAERVEKEFPDKFVGTLAYQYTRKPPKNIRPRDNVVIRFCSIECCFAHDFVSCPQNESFMDDLNGWAEIAPRIYVWDYVVSFSNYVMPFPNFSVLKSNIQTLRDHHAIGIMEQAAYQSRGGEFAELKAYLIAKLLWNPEAHVEPIIEDFMYGYYGRAGQYVREYFDLVQGLVSPDTHFTIWIQPENALYHDDFIRQGEAILDEAARVADNPEILARVDLVRLPLLYLKCYRMPQQALRDGSYDRLIAIKDREGVTHFAEQATEVWQRLVEKMRQTKEE